MATQFVICFVVFAALAFFIAFATDPNQLEDFCVATNDPNNAVMVNGMWCKNPSEVTADDFVFRGLKPQIFVASEKGKVGAGSTFVGPEVLPGLNGLGLSLARVDFVAGGWVAPHYHPRATEVLTLLEGSLYIGFVSFNQSNNSAKLFSKVLSPGDVWVSPQGLIHFTVNAGETNATAMVALSSQNPGNNMIPAGMFGTQPPISADLLSKAFKLDASIIEGLQSMF